MHLTKLLLAVMATATVTMAADIDCNANACGTCNGSSCKYGLINYSCGHGTSCLEGHGGGDGKDCEVAISGGAVCPGTA